ncbi:MAG: Cgl0159 family (beta/alpha)8-fold protein [Angustibacter sp.]
MTDQPALDADAYARILQARLSEPRSLKRALAGRPRRALLPADQRLVILAADHTARGMVAADTDPLAAADRRGLLSRLLTGLQNPRVDGVMASADILEELALLGALDHRLAIGTMNRGGIIGAAWELDDRLTAYDADHVAETGLDGGKMLLRLEMTDPGVARTIELAARLTTALADQSLMAMIEPLPYLKEANGRAVLDTSEHALVRVVGIASGLGSSSAYTWLKIPATQNPALVAAATTCPNQLLGGDAGAAWEAVFERWRTALSVPNVRGLVPGRALLYPSTMSPREAIGRAVDLVHGPDSEGAHS